MASQYTEPAAPQTEVTTVSTTNNTARRGPYTNRDITKRNSVETAAAATPLKSGSKTLGNIRRFYAEDKVEEADQNASNPGVTAPPHSPNSWQRGRDPYANGGMVGQTFYNQPS